MADMNGYTTAEIDKMKTVKVVARDGNFMVTDVTSGVILHPVHASIQMDMQGGTMISLLFATGEVDYEGAASFGIIHPATGKPEAVQRVEFKDGSVWVDGPN